MSVEKKLVVSLCVAFVIAIGAPMVASIVEADKSVSETENRALQMWPVYKDFDSMQSYFASINAYVNDHFGFRKNLIELNNKIKYSLNESPSKRIIRGDGDWFFLKVHDPLMSNQSTPKDRVRANVIFRADYIKRTHQELKEKGIAYQHIVVPNKMSLYREQLPRLYGLTDINATYSFFRQAMQDVNKTVAFDAIDILVGKKTNEFKADLYFKNDSHWNDLGAYYVYQESLARLKQSHSRLSLELRPHLFEMRRKYSGDLANMIGLQNRLYSQEPHTSFIDCAARSKVKLVKENLSVSICDANDTTMLLIADSFMTGIYKYMSESVGILYMTGQNATRSEIRKTIDDIKPDVVVEILVQRSLAKPLP